MGKQDYMDRGYVFCKPNQRSLEREMIDSGEKVFDTGTMDFRRNTSLQANADALIDQHKEKIGRLNSICLSPRSSLQSYNFTNSCQTTKNGYESQQLLSLNHVKPSKMLLRGQYPTKVAKSIFKQSQKSQSNERDRAASKEVEMEHKSIQSKSSLYTKLNRLSLK